MPEVQKAILPKRIATHAISVIFIEKGPEGLIKLPKMSYYNFSDGRTSFRQVMETGDPGETIRQTLRMAVLHEAARDATKFEWKLVTEKPIFQMIGPDDKNPDELHLKELYVVEKIKGEFRDFYLTDDNERVGPIEMVSAEDLLIEIEGKTPPFHIHAPLAALHYAASDTKVLNRYYKEIAGWRPPVLSEEEQKAIQEYPWK